MIRAAILLADGFEDIEAFAVIDILRRAGALLSIVGVSALGVRSKLNVRVHAELTLDAISDTLFDLLILPGGGEGVQHLSENAAVRACIALHDAHRKWIAAICAAPTLLESMGLLRGRMATSYPSLKYRFQTCIYAETSVVCSDHIITSRGPGTTFEFAYFLVEKLYSKAFSDALKHEMVFEQKV